MPTFGSLFAGIGGLDLGLERAGWECCWQVESDEWCRRVLGKHWPDVVRYGDIREVDSLPPVDLICGGFPCQPISRAGKGLVQADQRWLWPEFHRIIRLVRPRFVLVENVQALLGRGFGDVLGDLAASGYDAEWDCLPAAAFGAPHLRDRVFLVAHASSPRLQGLGTERGLFQALSQGEVGGADWWATEPNVGRVADGIPHRVDRLRGLGNAVVPQVAEWIGRRLLDAA